MISKPSKKKLATNAYNFRLDPRIPKEKFAVDFLIEWQAKGYTVRQLITELILHNQGVTFSEPTSDSLSAKALRRLEDTVTHEVLEILKQIRDGNPGLLNAFRQTAEDPRTESPFGDTEPIDLEMIAAIQSARRGKPLVRGE